MSIAEEAIALLKKKLADKIIETIVSRYFMSASWIMNPILGFFVNMIIDYLYAELAFDVNWVWNIIENHLELKSAIKTKDTLRLVLAAGGDYKKAEEAFNNSTDDIIHVRH